MSVQPPSAAPGETPPRAPADPQRLKREATMMKLERLIAERETVTDVEFPIPVAALLARYEQLASAIVSDVLREFCLLDQAFPGSLLALRPERTFAGIAFTVKSAPNTRITGEMTFRIGMLEAMPEHAVVVWDTSGDDRGTMWGGVMTATVVAKGVRGAIIDGGIRDTGQILEKNFPVLYRYRSPNGSLGRCLITHYQLPVRIGDVLVRPGDVIVGDGDGAVAVPRALAMAVLERAEAILANEKQIFEWVAAGETVGEITDKGGYF
jgi:4-hydroxy-4-methyl-2-oxoglutarate aldolase